ncbi:porin [Botryobacter ruber]|uniref:porin n=1 Tax=Botryobacter ruber TaxID=2171629 RepID=UPI000E0CABEB|nr:porin [Botryobacter ruber]
MKLSLPALTALLLNFTLVANAQNADSVRQDAGSKPFAISGAVDVYYAYDISKPPGNNRAFTTQAFRHNEFNLNWGFLQAHYESDKIRATFGVHTGTYVQANYAAEPNDLTRLIAQAHAGVKLGEGLWLDMGILPSHIGYESTFSGDNEIYTRALMAENSPYYETGARLTAELSEQLTLKLLVLNGWQIIRETNQAKSLGFSMAWQPTEQLKLSYNNYYGNEAPDGMKAQRRFFHNFYASYALTGPLKLAASADYGRQRLLGSTRKRNWYAALLLAQYQVSTKLAVAGRVEHYNDKDQVIITTYTANGFQTSSASLNLDYAPAKQLLLRLEARGYDSKDEVFRGEDQVRDKNALLVTSMSYRF